MKNKKLLALLVLSCSALSLFACNNKKNDSSSTTNTEPTSSETATTSNNATTSTTSEEIKNNEITLNVNNLKSKTFRKAVKHLNKEVNIPEGYEQVVATLNPEDIGAQTLASDYKNGPFTVSSGTSIRGRNKKYESPTETLSFTTSIKLGGTGNQIKVEVFGQGTMDVYVQCSSSGIATLPFVITKPDNSSYQVELPGTSESSDFPGYSNSAVVKVSLEVNEGTYIINRPSGKTADVFLVKTDTICQKSNLVGFEISSEGKNEYIEGETFDESEIALQEVYDNGKRTAIDMTSSDVVIDKSKVNTSVPGTYEVSVKYKNFEAQKINVTVFEVEDVKLGFNSMEKGDNSKYNNSTYVNSTVKRVYKKGDTFNTNYLSYIATCKNVTTNEVKEVNLTGESQTNGSLNTDSSSTYNVKVNFSINNKTFNANYNVYVVCDEVSIVDNVVQVKVDSSYQGQVGKIVDGYNMFTSIQQALDFLNNNTSKINSLKKVIKLADGTYNEKLEVTIPNLSIIGSDKDKVKIEWDSLFGLCDESGYEHVTDSTATLNIRDSADNFYIEGVTVSNAFNSLKYFDDILGENYAEHRALALLVQSDKFVMNKCSLLGYQDTVEFFTGRQIVVNSYIEGATDFIFGTNNTTLFKNCEIHSMKSQDGKGGYVTAFKGCNKGDSDYIKYGAIFDECNFTADNDVPTNATNEANATAIGRTWGKYAAVTVMNSTLGNHISKNISRRYVNMNADPQLETVKFFEYNNKGDGALSSSVGTTMTYLDESTAKEYQDLTKVFAATNGLVTFQDAWNVSLDSYK